LPWYLAIELHRKLLSLTDAKESVDGKWLYFAQGDADSEIRIVSISGGEHRPLAGMPKVRNATYWTLAGTAYFS
jgi:hypothetical protein